MAGSMRKIASSKPVEKLAPAIALTVLLAGCAATADASLVAGVRPALRTGPAIPGGYAVAETYQVQQRTAVPPHEAPGRLQDGRRHRTEIARRFYPVQSESGAAAGSDARPSGEENPEVQGEGRSKTAAPGQGRDGQHERSGEAVGRRQRFVRQSWPGLPGYVVLDANIAYGHQPEATGLQWLKRRGFVTVLDLRSEPDPAEAPLVEGLGLQYVNLPLPLNHAISQEDYARLKEVLSHPRYRPLFVHDERGERFAAVWLSYRVREGNLTIEEATEEVRQIGLPTDTPLWRLTVRELTPPGR